MKTDLIERASGSTATAEISEILHTVYQAQRPRLEAEAQARGITVEALAAAATAGMLAERLWVSSTP